jgi:hypothetical protein
MVDEPGEVVGTCLGVAAGRPDGGTPAGEYANELAEVRAEVGDDRFARLVCLDVDPLAGSVPLIGEGTICDQPALDESCLSRVEVRRWVRGRQ